MNVGGVALTDAMREAMAEAIVEANGEHGHSFDPQTPWKPAHVGSGEIGTTECPECKLLLSLYSYPSIPSGVFVVGEANRVSCEEGRRRAREFEQVIPRMPD